MSVQKCKSLDLNGQLLLVRNKICNNDGGKDSSDGNQSNKLRALQKKSRIAACSSKKQEALLPMIKDACVERKGSKGTSSSTSSDQCKGKCKLYSALPSPKLDAEQPSQQPTWAEVSSIGLLVKDGAKVVSPREPGPALAKEANKAANTKSTNINYKPLLLQLSSAERHPLCAALMKPEVYNTARLVHACA